MTTTTREGGKLRVLGLLELAAGLWLLAAPFVLGYPRYHPHQRAIPVDLLVGALVAMLAVLHLLNWDTARWASRVDLVLGLALAAAPAVLGYGSDPAIRRAVANDLVTGAVIVVGAGLSLAGSRDR